MIKLTNENIKETLDNLQNGSRVQIELICPDDLNELLKELGTELNEDFDTNGWECDFWMNFDYNGKQFVFDGSWYYGKYTIFREQ